MEKAKLKLIIFQLENNSCSDKGLVGTIVNWTNLSFMLSPFKLEIIRRNMLNNKVGLKSLNIFFFNLSTTTIPPPSGRQPPGLFTSTAILTYNDD